MNVPQWIVDVLDSVFVPPPPKVIRYCPMCGIKQETTPKTIGNCDLVFCEKCEPKVKEYAAFINSDQRPPLHHLQYEALRKTVYKYNSITGGAKKEAAPGGFENEPLGELEDHPF